MRTVVTPEDLLENVAYAGGWIDFILVKADMVAMDVIEWMPAEDNAKHHNAVEALRRIHETCEMIKAEARRLLQESTQPTRLCDVCGRIYRGDECPARSNEAHLKEGVT